MDTRTDAQALWESYLQIERGLSARTIESYKSVIHDVRASNVADSLVDLEHVALRLWVHSRGGSASSIALRISALKSFYRFLVRTEQRTDDPTMFLDAPRKSPSLPKPVADLPAVLLALDEIDWRTDGRRPGESRQVATFLAETGLRISEACALDVPVPCPAEIMVLGKGSREALIPLTDKARAALDFLGGRFPVGPRAVQRRLQKVGTHPHALRHHLGCELAASGADLGEIQDLLRHKSPVTTRSYAAYSLDRLRAAQSRRR